MKKLFTLLTVLLLTASIMQAQALKDSWSLGFGGSLMNITSTSGQLTAFESFGGTFNLQRNFTEHTALRLGFDLGFFSNSPAGNNTVTSNITSFAGHLDLVYYFMPCESFSPFVAVGVGQNVFSADNSELPGNVADIETAAMQVGFSIGAEANISDNWKLKGEFGSYQIASTGFDGTWGSEGYGMLGANSDAFARFDLGLQWYFSKGEPSKICQLYDGLEMPDPVDYERLENIVKKYIPREVVKEVVVVKEVAGRGMNLDNMVLMGVNYDFSSNRLKPESYPILYHTANVMKQNPDFNVEVQGYTDNIGSEKSNKALSQRRADSVKNYLIARGISASRVKAVGYGESNPIGDNKDASGRAMNRRIEFKVLD